MSLFGNRKQPEESFSQKGDGFQNTYNILGKGTEIIGNIISDGDIRIDGVLKGNLESRSKVILGPSGVIQGNVHCENMDVEGSVLGKIECAEILFIKNNAHIEGDIHTNKLVVENGAVFNGQCSMGNSQSKMNEHVSYSQEASNPA